jgi:hypothetical protein
MIFSITFVLALLLTHVAHALPPITRSTTVRATFDNMYDNAALAKVIDLGYLDFQGSTVVNYLSLLRSRSNWAPKSNVQVV